MSLLGTAIVAVIFVLLFLLERFFPLRQRTRPQIERLISNIGVTALAFAVNATAVQFATHITQQWTSDNAIGLITFFLFQVLCKPLSRFC